jgi:hypothetical protein
MSPQIPVFAELIEREIKRRNCSETDFAAICRIPAPRLQQILEADISPTASEVGLIAPWIAKDEAGTTFWTAEEMSGLVP